MHPRLATTRDLHRLTAITVSSLPDGQAFDYMWPYRHQYPEDNFFFWQLKLQEWLYDKKCTFIVMVLDNDDESPLATPLSHMQYGDVTGLPWKLRQSGRRKIR